MRQHPLRAIARAVVAAIARKERIMRVARHSSLGIFGRHRAGFTAMARVTGTPVPTKCFFFEEALTHQQVRRVVGVFRFALCAGR
jgi:hypothetical protein